MEVAINTAASRPASSLYQPKAVEDPAPQSAVATPTETKVTISDAAKELLAASEGPLVSTTDLGGATVNPMNTGLEPPPPPEDPEKEN